MTGGPVVAAPDGAADRPDPTAADEAVARLDRTVTERGAFAAKREAERRARASQSFWTVAVGVPAIFSVLRLAVEAGGELQTTLLLVANVSPVNLIAAMVTTAAPLVSAGLVVVFAIGAVLRLTLETYEPDLPTRRWPIFARWTEAAPVWFIASAFGLAAITWQIMYLPLLLPATATAFQLTPLRVHPHPAVRSLLIAGALLAYGWLVAGTVYDAWAQRELLVVLLFVAPPVLALFVSGPLPAAMARPFALLVQPAALVLLLATTLPVITAPVLPLTVTTIEADDGSDEDIRGHVISVDEAQMAILEERGGVRYVSVADVKSRVLCPTSGELPRYQLRLRDFHIEDSLLEGLGRQVRPATRIDIVCR